MNKRFQAVIAVMLIAVTLLAALPASAADQKMKVTASWLRLRQGPGTNYAITGKCRNGTIVTVLTSKTARHWYYVRTPNGKTGWMYKGYLTSAGSAVTPKETAGGTAVARRNVNMRTGPSKKYEVLQVLPAGQAMTITGRTGGWYQVKVGKTTGYVMRSLVKVK